MVFELKIHQDCVCGQGVCDEATGWSPTGEASSAFPDSLADFQRRGEREMEGSVPHFFFLQFNG